MNQVTLMGRLTRDPELRQTQGGKDVVSFTVACDRGDNQADFVPCVAWEKTAKGIHDYFKKGQRILVTGRFSSRDGETRDGQKRTFYEVAVSRFEFVESKRQPAGAPQEGMTPTDDDLPF